MFRWICLLTAVLVVPFGLAVVPAPAFVFNQFGIPLEGTAKAVAQGYGATALGYTAILLLLRDTDHGPTIRAVLIGSVIFNVIEVAIQVPLALQGQVSAMIWVTIIGHAALGLLSILALLRGPLSRS